MEMKGLIHFCIFADLQMSFSAVWNVLRYPPKVPAISVRFWINVLFSTDCNNNFHYQMWCKSVHLGPSRFMHTDIQTDMTKVTSLFSVFWTRVKLCVTQFMCNWTGFAPSHKIISRLQGLVIELRGSDLRFSGILRSVWWQFLTDVSGQLIGPILKGQEIQDPWNVSKKLSLYVSTVKLTWCTFYSVY
jgi:hypothetical protein